MQDKMRTGQNHGNVLCFSVTPYRFCLPAVEVVSIITPPRLTRLPFSAADVPGVFRYQGEIATCYDLRCKFSLPPRPVDQPGRLLLGRDDGVLLAFLVDEVSDIRPGETLNWRTVPLPTTGERIVNGCYLDDRSIILATSIRGLHRSDSSAFHALSSIALRSISEDISASMSDVTTRKETSANEDTLRIENQAMVEPARADAGELVGAEPDPAESVVLHPLTLASTPARDTAESSNQGSRDNATQDIHGAGRGTTEAELPSDAGSKLARPRSGRVNALPGPAVAAGDGNGAIFSSANSCSNLVRQDTLTTGATETGKSGAQQRSSPAAGPGSVIRMTSRPGSDDSRAALANGARQTVTSLAGSGADSRFASNIPYAGRDHEAEGQRKAVADDSVSTSLRSDDAWLDADIGAEQRRPEASVPGHSWAWGLVAVMLLLTVAYPLMKSRLSVDTPRLKPSAVSASTVSQAVIGQEQIAAGAADGMYAETTSGRFSPTEPVSREESAPSPALSDDTRLATNRLQEILRIEDNDLLIKVERQRQARPESMQAGTRSGDDSQAPDSVKTSLDVDDAMPAIAASDAVPQGRSATRRLPAPENRAQLAVAEHVSETENQDLDILMPGEFIRHRVVHGDTLWHIAKHYLGDPFRYPQLARLSRIRNPDLIYPGDLVTIARRHSADRPGE